MRNAVVKPTEHATQGAHQDVTATNETDPDKITVRLGFIVGLTMAGALISSYVKWGTPMRIATFAFAAAFASIAALPAAAQTTQTTPTKPTPSITTPTPGSTTRATPSSALVDINSASAEDLDKLPGIGPTRAAAIIKNRPYKGKDDLVSRKVIPANVYKGISSKIIAHQG